VKKRTNKRVALLLPFALLASFAFAGLPGSAAAQSSTANKVVDFETMTGTLNSDGSLNTNTLSLLDDLRVTGSGDVTVVDPNSTTDLRNLMGYSGPSADGTNQVKYTINNLNGTKQFLTASKPVGKAPPVALGIAYTLNGQNVASGSDLIGKSGNVGITFTVKNTTTKTQVLKYKDSSGHTLSSPQPVALPLVANLQVTLPPNVFTQVDAPGSSIVTDGFGNKIVNWGLVLVPPVGDVTQSVTLNANTDNFSLGQVVLGAAPVAPESRQYLTYTQDQFQNAITTSGSLYSGTLGIAGQLDQVNAGALKIIGGLEKLYKGQLKLANGLAGAIDPNGQLITGIGKLKGGLNGLIGGLNKVKAGIGPAKPKLENGIASLDSGLNAIVDCLTGTGKIKCQGHSINGSPASSIVNGLEAGLNVCLQGLITNCPFGPTLQADPSVSGYTTQIEGELDRCLVNNTATGCHGGPSIPHIAADPTCTADPTCASAVAAVMTAATATRAAVQAIANNIILTVNNMMDAHPANGQSILVGLQGIGKIANGLAGGIGNAPTQSQITQCAAKPSTCTVRSGLGAIENGVTSGFTQLLAGLGSADPASVNACLADSSKCTLLSGEGAVLNGIGQLQTGLVSGLQTAVDGANIIATCIGAAGNACKPPGSAKGGPSVKGGMSQLQQGVYAINELGVKEVARQANDTQGNLGAQLAVMQAENQRAKDDSLTYGPPSSSQAQTVIGGSSVVLTMNALDNHQNQTVSRGVMAGIALLLLFGLGMLGIRSMRRSAA